MVAGEAIQAAEPTGVEAMGQRAEKDAERRAAAALGTEGMLGEDGSQGQKRKFVAASTSTANKSVALENGRKIVAEEIDIDDDGPVQMREVPLAVFGSSAIENSA